MNTARSRRCSHCDTNWPVTPAFEQCPIDGHDTWLAAGETPLGVMDANKRVDEYKRRQRMMEDFERYYEEREARLARVEVEEFLRSAS